MICNCILSYLCTWTMNKSNQIKSYYTCIGLKQNYLLQMLLNLHLVSYGDLVMCALRSGLTCTCTCTCTEHAYCESPSCQKSRINHLSWHPEILELY